MGTMIAESQVNTGRLHFIGYWLLPGYLDSQFIDLGSYREVFNSLCYNSGFGIALQQAKTLRLVDRVNLAHGQLRIIQCNCNLYETDSECETVQDMFPIDY